MKRELAGYDDDLELSFDGRLSFSKIKRWGDDEIIILFEEPQAFQSDDFKKKYPNVKVAFIDISEVEWDENGIIGGPINVGLN